MMLVTFRELPTKWYKLPRFIVETYDKVFDEYIVYNDMTWLEMVFLLRYFNKRGADVRPDPA